MIRTLAFCLALAIPMLGLAADEGLTSLFDGKSLDGWQGGKDGYEVREGAIVSLAQGGSGKR